MRRSPVDPTKATRRPSGVGGHTIRVGANRGRYPTATGRLESSTPAPARRPPQRSPPSSRARSARWPHPSASSSRPPGLRCNPRRRGRLRPTTTRATMRYALRMPEGKIDSAVSTKSEPSNMAAYRDVLIALETKSQTEYDRLVVALSGGALGISFAFVERFVGDDPPLALWTLMVALGAWVCSLALMLGSRFFRFFTALSTAT